jgi:hypothetical protein
VIRVLVEITVGPFHEVQDMHLVVDVLRAVFDAVPPGTEIPVETRVITDVDDGRVDG